MRRMRDCTVSSRPRKRARSGIGLPATTQRPRRPARTTTARTASRPGRRSSLRPERRPPPRIRAACTGGSGPAGHSRSPARAPVATDPTSRTSPTVVTSRTSPTVVVSRSGARPRTSVSPPRGCRTGIPRGTGYPSRTGIPGGTGYPSRARFRGGTPGIGSRNWTRIASRSTTRTRVPTEPRPRTQPSARMTTFVRTRSRASSSFPQRCWLRVPIPARTRRVTKACLFSSPPQHHFDRIWVRGARPNPKHWEGQG